MTPQSFEALALQWKVADETDLHLCHVVGMKYKTDTEVRSMSASAGFGGDEPVSCIGLEGGGELGYRLWGYRAQEMWDDLYLRFDYQPQDAGWYATARYLGRWSAGDRLASDVDTWHLGLNAGLRQDAWHLFGALSQNGVHDVIRAWGHDTTISNQVHVADRAEEFAWLLGAKYAFAELPGLNAAVSFASLDTPDSGVNASPDRREWNLDLQYQFNGNLKGLGLRGRNAWVDERGAGAESLNDFRLYLEYTFEL
jgi:hypothetical protein